MLILLFLLFAGTVFAEYCIQVAANPDFDVVKGYYEHVKKFEKARIEKKGNVYLLRVGATNIRSDLQAILPFIKRRFPDAYIKICEINDEYVVYPRQDVNISESVISGDEPRTSNPVSYKEDINQIKKNIEFIKDKIEKMGAKEGVLGMGSTADTDDFLRNFIIITGIIAFSLMLIMFILLVIILKNIKKSNGDVMRVFLEMINALKILNLLNNGYVLRMEGGKLLVWDEKERKWKEVKS